MKYVVLLVSFFIFGFTNCEAKDGLKPLSIESINKRFGSTKFNAKLFKGGKLKEKAAMSYDLIKSQKYVGSHRSEVLKKLGEPTGYFRSETFLAYLIFVSKKGHVEALQLLFVPDKSGVIRRVIVHNQAD